MPSTLKEWEDAKDTGTIDEFYAKYPEVKALHDAVQDQGQGGSGRRKLSEREKAYKRAYRGSKEDMLQYYADYGSGPKPRKYDPRARKKSQEYKTQIEILDRRARLVTSISQSYRAYQSLRAIEEINKFKPYDFGFEFVETAPKETV